MSNLDYEPVSEDVIEIRNMYKYIKCTQIVLSLLFGVSRSAIAGIISRKKWKHLDKEYIGTTIKL